jgi:hypothetical protein
MGCVFGGSFGGTSSGTLVQIGARLYESKFYYMSIIQHFTLIGAG